MRKGNAALGRKLEWPEKFLASFALGTLARIDAARKDSEDRRSFIRRAVEGELKRRDDPAGDNPDRSHST